MKKVRYLFSNSSGNAVTDKTLWLNPKTGLGLAMGMSASERKALTSDGIVFWTKSLKTSGGSCGMHLDHSVGYQGETAAQATAVRGLLRVLSGCTVTNGTVIYEGAAGYFKNEGILNDDSISACGLRGCIVDGGTYTKVGHLTAAWLDWQNNSQLVAGNSSMMWITNNANSEYNVGAIFEIDRGQDGWDFLFKTNGACAVQPGFVITTNVALTAQGDCIAYVVEHNDETYYIQASKELVRG